MADKQITELELRKRYMQTFGTESGHMVLKDLANRCHKRDSTFNPDVTGNPELTFINEGKRQVLLHIEGMMSPEGIAILANAPEKGSE